MLLCIPKILKNESNSQRRMIVARSYGGCCVSQRYWKMKAIHNYSSNRSEKWIVVVYPKDTEKWKQFTTKGIASKCWLLLLCIPKILKNESNSQRTLVRNRNKSGCCVSQRYWKMKAIHNTRTIKKLSNQVVVYPKDTEKWKQFTTSKASNKIKRTLLCIPKILKNESNSQQINYARRCRKSCCVSQRYWKMKAIHNVRRSAPHRSSVVVYPKDTEKWKQFTTTTSFKVTAPLLLCIPKILKNESNSQLLWV